MIYCIQSLTISSTTTPLIFISSIAFVVRIKEVTVECNSLLSLSRVDNLPFDISVPQLRHNLIKRNPFAFFREKGQERDRPIVGRFFVINIFTSANFQERGKIPRVQDALIKAVIIGRVAGRLSLIVRTGIFSIPGDLFAGIDLTIFKQLRHNSRA